MCIVKIKFSQTFYLRQRTELIINTNVCHVIVVLVRRNVVRVRANDLRFIETLRPTITNRGVEGFWLCHVIKFTRSSALSVRKEKVHVHFWKTTKLVWQGRSMQFSLQKQSMTLRKVLFTFIDDCSCTKIYLCSLSNRRGK